MTSRNICTEVTKIKANWRERSSTVDGMSSDCGIADVFMQSYKKLLLACLMTVQCQCSRHSSSKIAITYWIKVIIKIISSEYMKLNRLSLNFRQNNCDLNNEHFVCMLVMICNVTSLCYFLTMIVCGYCPGQLTTSTVILIPKGGNVNLTDSSN